MKNLLGLLFIAGNCFSFSLTGSGTPEDPFLITNIAELQEMKDSLSAHYRLANDIDASETASWNVGDHDEDSSTPDSALGFYPIGTSSSPFTGSLNGSGYAVTNLRINRPTADYTGLFGYLFQGSVDSLALVDNVVIGRRAVDGVGRTGGLIGYTFSGVSVSNCYTTGHVTGGAQVGGLIGYAYGAIEVNECFTTGTVDGSGYVGGLIGHAFLGVTVNNSYSSATITYKGTGVGIGGIIGNLQNSSVHRSYFTGTVDGKQNAGGIVGDCRRAIVSECFNSGTVAGYYSVGGVVGFGVDSSVIRDCYSTGTVRGDYSNGGIAGELLSSGSEIVNCYSTSQQINVLAGIGGILGINGEQSSLSGCFWDTTISQIDTGIGTDFNAQEVTAETSENLKSAVTYTNSGWDFVGESVNGTDDIWNIANGYPFLAFYTLNSFTLTYLAGNGGVIDGNDQQTISIGMNGVAVSAQPDNGYVFTKWSDGRTDNPRIDYNVISDLSYTAEFELSTDVMQARQEKIPQNIVLSGNNVRFSVPGPFKVQFYSISGKLLKEITDNVSTIELTNPGFASGIYMVRVVQGSNELIGRFVVK